MHHTNKTDSAENNQTDISETLIAAKNQIIEQANKIQQLEVQLSHLANQISAEKPSKKEGLDVNSRQLNLILQNIQLGLLLENSERKIVLVNETFTKLFGIPLSPEQMLGFDCAASAGDTSKMFEDEQGFLEEIDRSLTNKTKVEKVLLKLKDGRYFKRDYIPLWKEDIYDGHLWVYIDVTRNELAQIKIIEQEKFYSEILNEIPADIAAFDKDHRYLFVNPYGIKNPEIREWIIGKTDYDYCSFRNKPYSIADERHEHFKAAFETKQVHVWNEEVVDSEGNKEYHMRMMYPVLNAQNEVTMVIGYGLNITQSKKNELALLEANRNLTLSQFIIDNSYDAMQVSQEDGRMFYLNTEAIKRLGIEAKRVSEYFVQDFEQLFNDELLWEQHVAVLKKNESIIVEGENINVKTGISFPVEVTVKYLKVGDNGYIIASSRDITMRRNFEQALLRKQGMLNAIALATNELLSNPNFYNAIYKSLPWIGQAVNVDRTYLFENSFDPEQLDFLTSQRFEWTNDKIAAQIDNPELQNVPINIFGNILDTLYKKEPYKAIVSEINNKEVRELLEYQDIKSILIIPIMHKDFFWGFVGYDDCKNDREWSDDEVALLQSFANSISNAIERNQLENNALKAKEIAEKSTIAKSEFLAQMSHEVRTPMNAFLGMTKILAKTKLDETQQKYLNIISDSADNLLAIVNDVLDLEKINSGKINLETLSFDLESRIEKSIETFNHRAAEKGLKLQFISDLPIKFNVNGDPHRLTQVINNLLGNSIKFTSNGKVGLKVKISHKKNDLVWIEIVVSDSGIGIKQDQLENIFDPYSQGGKEIARLYGGTGLGLSICQSIIEMQGGSVKVESEYGKGSTFTILLPFRQSADEFQNEVEVTDEDLVDTESLVGLKILAAEDVEINRFMLNHILNSWGCEVTMVNDGNEAVECFLKNKYDIILMDIQMPEKDGIEASKEIISSHNYNGTPIIALTANALLGDAKKYLSMGFSHCITKPFDEKTLSTIIINAVHKRKILLNLNEGQENLNEPLYSLKHLNLISNGKKEFVDKMVALFVNDTPNYLLDLSNAYKNNDVVAFSKHLHKLKPSLAHFEIHSVSAMATKMQSIIKEQGLEFPNKFMVQEFITTIELCINDLKKNHLSS
jgi:PAS domain S-box-containing protein